MWLKVFPSSNKSQKLIWDLHSPGAMGVPGGTLEKNLVLAPIITSSRKCAFLHTVSQSFVLVLFFDVYFSLALNGKASKRPRLGLFCLLGPFPNY